MNKQVSKIFSAVLILILMFSALPMQTAQAISPDIVISQVYGGGGNSGATLTNDFIELFNRGTSPVSVAGWSVQYASSSGSTWQVTIISGTIQPGQYFLVQEAAGAGGTTPLPTPDVLGSIAMSGSSGKVVVANTTTALSGTNPADASIVDVVGYGGANFFEGSAAAPGLSNTTADSRAGDGCTDTDDNSADFTAGAPNPRNSASPQFPCGGGGSSATELFMSEYIEGSSLNKAIEIYNGTNAAVDLAAGDYDLEIYFNGSTSVGNTVDLTGVIAAGDVFVVADDGADAAILAVADQTDTGNFFNGDDVVLLKKAGVVVDSFGQLGVDPGSQWAGGGQDDTLRRKADICAGDTNPDDAFDASVEWDSFAQNTFDGLGSHTATCGGGSGPSDPVINEFSASTTGADVEYVEIFGAPNTDYSAYTVLEIEGDSSSNTGTVDEVISLGTTDADGFYLASLPANALENGSISLLLVKNFTGALGDDLDTNDDGAFDATPWDAVVDAVSVNDGGSSDLTYGIPALGRNYDGLSNFAPGGASRIPDGFDTDSATDWARNDFDLYGIPGFTGTQQIGEAVNTPGAPNEVITVIVDPFGVCGDSATMIHDIQGSGLASTDTGNIRAVEAVVTATFYGSNEIGGYFLQEEDTDVDSDPLTSEGLRVFDTTNSPSVGDVVRIRGSVTEFFGLTELNNVTDFADCGTGVATAATVNLPVTSVDDFERYEGMYVTFPQALVISEYFNYDRFGEIVLTSERHLTPTAEFEPGPDAVAAANAFLLDKITVDDGRGNQNPDPAIHPNGNIFDLTNLFRGGDTVQNLTGVLDYNFGAYKVQPTQGADYTNTNLRTASPDDVGGNLKVASFNVLNYFTTLDDSNCPYSGGCRGADANQPFEFTRQRDKIIAALAEIDADVVGLLEIENHPSDVSTADLVSGLNDVLGAGTYAYVSTGAIGTDAIKVALIYKPASVDLVGNYAILDSTVDTRFIDTKNRPTLAQTFMNNSTGGVFTVAVNHLKSKGSDCNDVGDPNTGDGAGNCNLTRKAAAEAMVDWLASDPTGSGDDDFLIIGDLNSYDKEDPIDAILAGGYTDMIYAYHGEGAYSYVFDGQIGYLDYALASADLIGEATGVTEWHINADEPDLIDYDTSFKGPNQDAIYAPDAYRSSDHDPVIVGLELTTAAEIQELIDDVQKLVDDGVLNNGQGNALITKLEHALEKLADGKPGVAANQLSAFINQVEDFVYEGVLTAEQGDLLIKAASLLVGVLN